MRDGFGDIIRRASSDGGTTVYVYNAMGKPTQVTEGDVLSRMVIWQSQT